MLWVLQLFLPQGGAVWWLEGAKGFCLFVCCTIVPLFYLFIVFWEEGRGVDRACILRSRNCCSSLSTCRRQWTTKLTVCCRCCCGQWCQSKRQRDACTVWMQVSKGGRDALERSPCFFSWNENISAPRPYGPRFWSKKLGGSRGLPGPQTQFRNLMFSRLNSVVAGLQTGFQKVLCYPSDPKYPSYQ